ncbi:hypothetical protein [Sinomonas terrae]|uniref:Uncharacterized protein n=1 Tax=Sinomonas terrae TaxID=2908838 RepID=A0ABS9U6U6_9MICC|nr:hypothetical protein [Sinomonas terrae]MCH6472423.1 hypothetical protein [Sinomonas terrae]
MTEDPSGKGPQQPGSDQTPPQPAPDRAPEAETEDEDEAWDNEGGHAPSAPRQGGTPAARERTPGR